MISACTTPKVRTSIQDCKHAVFSSSSSHTLRKTVYSLRMKMIPTCFLQETMNTQGQQREREAAAYEARMFCEMLLKGAVNIFEVRICRHGNYT